MKLLQSSRESLRHCNDCESLFHNAKNILQLPNLEIEWASALVTPTSFHHQWESKRHAGSCSDVGISLGFLVYSIVCFISVSLIGDCDLSRAPPRVKKDCETSVSSAVIHSWQTRSSHVLGWWCWGKLFLRTLWRREEAMGGRKDIFFFFIGLFFKDQKLRHSWLVGCSWENSFFLNLLKKEESNGVIVQPASVLAVILFLEGLGGLTFLGGGAGWGNLSIEWFEQAKKVLVWLWNRLRFGSYPVLREAGNLDILGLWSLPWIFLNVCTREKMVGVRQLCASCF